jgi:hypothetical protein
VRATPRLWAVVRAWFALVWKSVGMAIVAVAAQLGVAQTVGLIRWNDVSTESWSTLLIWLAFIAVVAVVAGAGVGRRAVRTASADARLAGTRAGRSEPVAPDRVGVTLLAALGGAIGASVGASLAWLAAQTAISPVTYPELVVATTAGAAVVAGTVLAVLAGLVPPIGRNVRVTVGWIWALGLFCAIAGHATHKPFRAPGLGVVDAPSLIPETWWSAPSVMVAISIVIGAVVAAAARWRGATRLGTIASGFAGPTAVAAAYLIVRPALQGAPTNLFNPFHASLIAVAGGLLGSAAVGLLPGPARSEGTEKAPKADRAARAVAAVAPHSPSRPAPPAARPSYEEDYSDWIRDIGPAGQTTAGAYGQPYESGFGSGQPR